MLKQLEILRKVCKDENINFKQIDENGNFLELVVESGSYYFLNAQTPFNRQDLVSICKDKEFTSLILKNLINTPKTKGYLDPNCSTEYKKYCKFNTLREIESDIKTNFKFPTIVKPNRGSGGKGVAKCNTQTELEQVLELVYNQANKDYDYIALVQEFIEIKKEYRVFCVNGVAELVYLKDNSQSTFIGNLSPLHWEGSKAVLISDLGFRNQVQSFVNPIFQKLNIFWCGLDIVIDQNNIMSLIEINTNPGLTIFLEQNDEQIVYNLYKTGLSKYFQSLNLLNRDRWKVN